MERRGVFVGKGRVGGCKGGGRAVVSPRHSPLARLCGIFSRSQRDSRLNSCGSPPPLPFETHMMLPLTLSLPVMKA